MTRQSLSDDRPELCVAVYALALALPPLLAYNRTPSATQLNELLCVFGWGLCMLAANRIAPAGGRRGAVTVLALAMGVMAAAVVGSWTLGSLPTSLALPPLLLLVSACFVAALGARVAQGGDPEGLPAFAPFAFGIVAAGVLSAIVAVIQVHFPALADGTILIAQSGIPGRAVGNLRQPNHLASLLVWSAIALVPLVEWGHVPRWLGGVLLLLIMYGVFLSGSRTGLLGGSAVLVTWAVFDSRLSPATRVALVVGVGFAWAMPWVSAHLPFGAHRSVGIATRASDGDSSHFAIWKNAIEMVQQQPWRGVGWGEFNFAWTLTPFPHRPTAFFDHTHDLPLQLIVELGIPLALLVLGLMVWALWQGLVRAWATQGAAGHGARAAWVMVVMIGIHSLDEYPLWYAYFLLPAAWAWGFTLGSGPAPKPAAEATLSGVVGGRPVDPGKLIRLSSEGSGLRWFGGAMVAVALLSAWDYWRVSTIFYEEEATSHSWSAWTFIGSEGAAPSLEARIAAGQTSPFFAHHADYAQATTKEPPSAALGALERATHSLLDSRLMIAWATALSESGQTERARYLVARLREFDKSEAVEFFAPCTDPAVTAKPFQCEPEPKGLTWRDFR
jgi:O-antigen ligase